MVVAIQVLSKLQRFFNSGKDLCGRGEKWTAKEIARLKNKRSADPKDNGSFQDGIKKFSSQNTFTETSSQSDETNCSSSEEGASASESLLVEDGQVETAFNAAENEKKKVIGSDGNRTHHQVLDNASEEYVPAETCEGIESTGSTSEVSEMLSTREITVSTSKMSEMLSTRDSTGSTSEVSEMFSIRDSTGSTSAVSEMLSTRESTGSTSAVSEMLSTRESTGSTSEVSEILSNRHEGVNDKKLNNNNYKRTKDLLQQSDAESKSHSANRMSNTMFSTSTSSDKHRSAKTFMSTSSNSTNMLSLKINGMEILTESVNSTFFYTGNGSLFMINVVRLKDAILPSIGWHSHLAVPGLTSRGYEHCCVTQHVYQLCPVLSGNELEAQWNNFEILLFEYFETDLKSTYTLCNVNDDILQARPTLDLLTSVDFEKLNNYIRVHVAVVFESVVYYYASLSLTELKTIAFNVKNGSTSIGSAFRMNLVTSRVFEEAMRDCRVHTFQLTYSYVYPRNCRMLIGIPVYKDGYINGKDRKQNR